MKSKLKIFYSMNQIEEIVETNEDQIGDLRRALNQEIFTREEFHKLTNVLKIMPEFFEMAKENN